MRRSAAIAFVLAAVVGGGTTGTPVEAVPVQGATPAPLVAAPCPQGSDGVTVVVDFGHFGGGVQVRCAPWPVTSGKDALRKAGFTPEDSRNPRFAGGFLCRIDALPEDGDCHGNPDYWAYWHASSPACTWAYSQSGYTARTPPAGSVEGYAFGSGVRPRTAPCSPPPTTTTTTRPAPPPPPPSGGSGGGGGGATGGGAGTTEPAAPGVTPPPDAPPDDPDTPTTTTAVAEVDDGTTTTTEADGRATTTTDGARVSGAAEDGAEEAAIGPGSRPEEPDGGSPVPALIAAAGLLGLLAMGAVASRRRARA